MLTSTLCDQKLTYCVLSIPTLMAVTGSVSNYVVYFGIAVVNAYGSSPITPASSTSMYRFKAAPTIIGVPTVTIMSGYALLNWTGVFNDDASVTAISYDLSFYSFSANQTANTCNTLTRTSLSCTISFNTDNSKGQPLLFRVKKFSHGGYSNQSSWSTLTVCALCPQNLLTNLSVTRPVMAQNLPLLSWTVPSNLTQPISGVLILLIYDGSWYTTTGSSLYDTRHPTIAT